MKKKEVRYYLMIGIIALLVCLGLTSLTNQIGNVDSDVFQYVAGEIQQGRVPYLDTFDHKGPLIYLINFLALSLSPRWGLWLFEFVTVYVTLLCFYRIAKLAAGSILSLFTVGLTGVFLAHVLEGGNFTEEYALPFLSISLYIFLQYFLKGRTRNRDVILCGVCFGCVLLLRPNMIAIWIVGCVLVLIDCFRKKTYAALLKFIADFLLGLGLCVAPFVVWLSANGALEAAFDACVTFNMQYSGVRSNLYNIVQACFKLMFHSIPLLSGFAVLVLLFCDRTAKSLLLFLCWLLSAFLIVSPGNNYLHYVLILLPIVQYPIAWLFSWCADSCKVKSKAAMCVFAVAVFLGTAPSAAAMSINILRSLYLLRNPQADPVVTVIQEKSDVGDFITVYGNANFYYLRSNRKSASRYSYQYPIGKVNSNIYDEYFEDLTQNPPKVIIWPENLSPSKSETDRMYRFIQEYGYLQHDRYPIVFYLP